MYVPQDLMDNGFQFSLLCISDEIWEISVCFVKNNIFTKYLNKKKHTNLPNMLTELGVC